jgi:hypothetical protein
MGSSYFTTLENKAINDPPFRRSQTTNQQSSVLYCVSYSHEGLDKLFTLSESPSGRFFHVVRDETDDFPGEEGAGNLGFINTLLGLRKCSVRSVATQVQPRGQAIIASSKRHPARPFRISLSLVRL